METLLTAFLTHKITIILLNEDSRPQDKLLKYLFDHLADPWEVCSAGCNRHTVPVDHSHFAGNLKSPKASRFSLALLAFRFLFLCWLGRPAFCWYCTRGALGSQQRKYRDQI